MLDRPSDCLADRFEKPLQLPLARAKGADVADRTHWDLDQAGWIREWLGLGLGLNNAGQNGGVRRFLWPGVGMRRVQAADPREAQVQQHFLQVFSANEAGAESAWSAEAAVDDARALV